MKPRLAGAAQLLGGERRGQAAGVRDDALSDELAQRGRELTAFGCEAVQAAPSASSCCAPAHRRHRARREPRCR